MPLTLEFDGNGFMQALTEKLIEVADNLMKAFFKEATQGSAYSSESKIEPAVLDSVSHMITAKCFFHANAIMESFGVGTGIDTSSEYLSDYINSDLWNPARRSTAVVGRPAGEYTNIYGKQAMSSGRMEGIPISFATRPAKMFIQKAEAWIMRDGTTKIERTVETEILKFIQDEAGKFFIQGSR